VRVTYYAALLTDFARVDELKEGLYRAALESGQYDVDFLSVAMFWPIEELVQHGTATQHALQSEDAHV